MAELEQLALDPLVSPAVVLGGEPPDQRGDLGADRRPSCLVRVGPLPGDQAAVPAQDGAGGDQPVYPQLSWQVAGSARPGRRGRPSRAGAWDWSGAARRPRAAAPAAPRPWTLTIGRAGPASRRAGRRSGRAGEGTRMIIMPSRASPLAPSSQRVPPTLGTRQAHCRSSEAMQTFGTPQVLRGFTPDGGTGGGGGIPAGVVDDHAVDPAQQGGGARDAGLGTPGAGRGLRRCGLLRSCAGCRGVCGAGSWSWYLVAITGLYWSIGQTARHTVSRRPGRPRREMCAWPAKAPEAFSDGDSPACLTSDDEPS